MIPAVSDIRRDPLTGAFSYISITDDPYTVAEFDNLPSRYGIKVRQRINPAGPLTIVENATGATPFEVVNNAPAAGQVQVDYETGLVKFNSADDGKQVLVTYQGGGSTHWKTVLEQVVDEYLTNNPSLIPTPDVEVNYTRTFFIDPEFGDNAGGLNGQTYDTLANFYSAEWAGLNASNRYAIIILAADSSSITVDKNNVIFMSRNNAVLSGTWVVSAGAAGADSPPTFNNLSFSGAFSVTGAASCYIRDCTFTSSFTENSTGSLLIRDSLYIASTMTFNNDFTQFVGGNTAIIGGSIVADGSINFNSATIVSTAFGGTTAAKVINFLNCNIITCTTANGVICSQWFIGGSVQGCTFDHQPGLPMRFVGCTTNGSTYSSNFSGTVNRIFADEIVADTDSSSGGLTVASKGLLGFDSAPIARQTYSGYTGIPGDDTPPLDTEGALAGTLSYTCKSDTSTLYFFANMYIRETSNTGDGQVAALFKSGVSEAIGVGFNGGLADAGSNLHEGPVNIVAEIASHGRSSLSYTVRVSQMNGANQIQVGGSRLGASLYSAALAAGKIVVFEMES